jgi:hypothetical protein
MALLDKVKVACRVTSTAYDDELTDLISAAFADIGIADVKTSLLVEDNILPLVQRAVITYCKLNFGYVQLEERQYDRLKASYDEQKAQMLMSSGYTNWGDSDA